MKVDICWLRLKRNRINSKWQLHVPIMKSPIYSGATDPIIEPIISCPQKQHQVMFDIEHCRTSYFGYHVDICDACDYFDQSHNSCRNRHCPKCQGIARRIWVNARLENLLPIPYYHVVFTLPHLLNPLVGYNRELIYNILFDCAAETLLQFGRAWGHILD